MITTFSICTDPLRAAVRKQRVMTFNGWLQIAIYCVLIFVFVKPFGAYMANVFDGQKTLLSVVLRPIERGIYAVCGVNEREEQHWTAYAISVLLFSIAGFVVLYALQRLQSVLPFNPAGQSAVEQSSSFNTAVSFRHEHELAGLRRRVDDELSHADGGAYHAELRVRRRWYCDRHRAGPRLRPPLRARRSATSGSI